MLKVFKWFGLGLYTIFTIIPHYFYVGLMCIINPEKASELKYKGKPIIPIAMIGLTLVTYLICVFTSTRWYVQQLKIKYLNNDIISNTNMLEDTKEEETTDKEYSPPSESKYQNISFLSVDFTDLLKKNPETVAWLKVNNTKVNYSVVEHDDNEYYLKHDFNRNYNISGWVFADYRDNFSFFGTNTIIYAHNMTNRTMFGSLVWVLKESWYKNEDNWYIKLSTPTSNTVWKIFSIYTTKPVVDYIKTYFEDDAAHQSFLDSIKAHSIYDFGEELTIDDKILTLSTCTDDGTKRIAIHAKMIKAEYR